MYQIAARREVVQMHYRGVALAALFVDLVHRRERLGQLGQLGAEPCALFTAASGDDGGELAATDEGGELCLTGLTGLTRCLVHVSSIGGLKQKVNNYFTSPRNCDVFRWKRFP